VTLDDANAAQPTFTAPNTVANTNVQFELTVHDGTNVSSVDTVTVTVNADNDAPTSHAGADQTVGEGDVVTLTGLGSSDPEGQGLTYTWVQTSGPAVTLSDANAAQPTFTAPEGISNTSVGFELTVSDGTNVSSVDTVTVTVNADNDAPSSHAGADQSVDEGDVVTLNGLGSSDPEGQGLTYTWVQTGGPTVTLSDANAAQPTFTAPEGVSNTSVQFELTVSDGAFTSTVDSVQVTIGADDDAPNADAGADQFVTEGDLVTLDAAGSSDPEGQSLTYTWTQTGGPAVTLSDANTAQPTFTAAAGANTYTFELTVNDGTNSSIDTVTIDAAATPMMMAAPTPPVADAGIDQTVDEGDVVVLTGLGSSDINGDALTYTWTQTSGPAVTLSDASAAQPTFTAPEGLANTSVQFQLTVSDGTFSSTADTITVNVQADNDAPTADAGSDLVADEGDRVTLDARGSADPEGQGLTYTWTQVGGPVVALDDPTAATPNFTAPEGLSNTSLRFQVAVSDGTNVSIDTVDVAVQADDDAPTADAGNPRVVGEGQVVTLDGTSSSDPEGQGLTYTWVQVGGPTVTLDDPTSATPTYTAPESIRNTAVQFELTVRDGASVSTDTVTHIVHADDDAPTADAGSHATVEEGDVVVLRGSGTDPEGKGLTYSWRQVQGPTVQLEDADSATTRFRAPESMRNTIVRFELTVSDGVNSSTDLVTFGIQADDDAPRIDAGDDQVVRRNQDVQLRARASDPENGTLSYQWRQIGGPSVDLQDGDSGAPTFTAPDLPEGTVLTFVAGVDDGTNQAFDTVTVVVAPNVGPQVTIDGVPDLASGAPGEIQANAADPDGDPLRFRWTQVGGPTARMPANDQPQLRFQAPEVDVDTTLTFQVEVFDGHRATIQVVNVQVQAATASAAAPEPQPQPAPPTTDEASGGDAVDAATSERDEAADRIREAIQSSASNRLDDVLATAAGNSLELDDRSDDDGSPGLLASVTLDADATSDDAGDNTAAGDEELRSSNLTGDASEAGLDSYYANLLEEPAAAATAAGTRIELPDLVLVEAGDAIELTARAAAEATAAELADARWTQVSGTPVDLDASGADGMLRIRTPELFVEEELVFEVEVWRGGERVVQEVTVQVEPVGMTSRSLSIDEHVEAQRERADTDEEQGARGVGRVWGALLAFFGAQSGRRKRDS
jgi:hypothetical protein